MGRHLSPRYGHGQQIPSFDCCQLTTTWMCHIRLQAAKLARQNRQCEILKCWLPCGADGREYGHVTIKISRIDGKPNFLSFGAPLVRGAPLLI